MHKENSLEETIARNSGMVYRLAYSLVKTGADADDIYQEVFFRYVKRMPAFDSAEHEKAWFIRVTVNCCKNHWKSPWMTRRAVYDEEALAGDGSRFGIDDGNCFRTGEGSSFQTDGGNRFRTEADYGLCPDMAPGGDPEPGEEAQRLIDTVKKLPEKYRVVIHLFYYEEMSVEEIGKATGTKASTVRTRLTRARRLLREKLAAVDGVDAGHDKG